MAYREVAIPSTLVLALVLLSACGGGGSGQQGPPPPSPSFTISVSPTTSQSNPLGIQIATSGGSITVGVTPHNGFSGTVNFSLSGLPTGVSANPPTWSITGSQTQVVTITANGNASSGPAQVTISGSSGSRSDSAAVFLRIDPFLSATIGPAGGTLAVTDPTSPLFGLELDIPAGALTQDTFIEMNPLIDIQSSQTASVLAVLGWGVNLKPDGLQLNVLATLQIPYPDSDQDGIVDGTDLDARFVSIHTFNTSTSDWLFSPTTLDSMKRVVATQIEGFSSKRWDGTKWLSAATYRILNYPNPKPGNPTKASVEESVARAIYNWAKHTKLAGITFTQVPVDQKADLDFEWVSYSSVFSSRYYACSLKNLFDDVDHCVGTVAETAGSTLTPKIYFNDDRTWTTDPADATKDNVEAVALHEMGHLLGWAGNSHFELLAVQGEDCNQPPKLLTGNCRQYQPPVMAARERWQARFLSLYPADLRPFYQLYKIPISKEYAYVTNQGSDSVSAVHLSDPHSVIDIALMSGSSNGPQGIAISDDRGKAYVAVYDAGSAYAIDLNTNRLWPFLPPTQTGAGSNEGTVRPDGSLAFVANSLGNSVSAISLSDPRVGFSNFPVTGPNGVAVTPDGKQVLVTSVTGTLAIIDMASQLESFIVLGQIPEAVAIEPNGRFAYVVEPGVNAGQVEVIDLCPGKDYAGDCHGVPQIIPPPIGVGNNPLAITLLFDKGRRLHHALGYVSNFFDGSISVIDLNTKTVVGQISDLMEPLGMALTPDDSRLYVADFLANAMWVVDTDTNKPDPNPIAVGSNPVGIAITSHPIPAPFDFGLDSFSVDGNILGSGDPNGIPDFIDEFNDTDPLKALTEFPTSWFFFRQGITGTDESGGFLNLRSSDGADFIGSFLRDTAELLPAPLTKGGGNSVMTAKFRAELLQPGQAYCLGVWNGMDYSEYTLICVEGNASSTTVRVHNQDGTLGETQVNLAGKGRVDLRFDVSEKLNDTVIASSRVDNDTYTIFPNTGTIFTQSASFYAFIQGGTFVQGSLPFVSQSQGNRLSSKVNSSQGVGNGWGTGRRPVPPPPAAAAPR